MTIYTETIPYFYIIQHIKSKRMYVGSKWVNGSNPQNFMVENGYTTSSKIVNSIIKAEGLSSFIILRIDTYCDGLRPYDYETAFLEINDCAGSNLYFNGHNNRILPHNSIDFKQIMLSIYGVDHWSKTPAGKLQYSRAASIKNKLPENKKRWDDMNKYNNPSKKIENRIESSKRMIKYLSEIGENHAAKLPENREICRKTMKKTLSVMEELTCIYCGFKSKSQGNIYKWHNDNCNKNPNRKATFFKCIWCDKECRSKTNYMRWHNDNCKMKS